MAHIVRPTSTTIKVAPKEGELEITVNINITIDGQISATTDGSQIMIQSNKPEKNEKKEENDDKKYLVPDFASGLKLNFGKDK
jgi:hypothetical protein